MNIRAVELKDAKKLSEIYNYYVLNTTISYEDEAVTEADFSTRIEAIITRYPYIVLEDEGEIVGYAYASPYHGRKAYSWDTELTVYLNKDKAGRGAGTILYQKLIDILTAQNFVNAYALIDYPNDPSMALHKKFGFTEVGLFKKTGFKFSKWLDMIILEKKLQEPEIPDEIVADWQQFL